MNFIEGGQGWVALIGGLLLAGVLLWALLKNKAQPRSEVERSERGAKDLRERIDAEDDD